jgi:hypothetical protein
LRKSTGLVVTITRTVPDGPIVIRPAILALTHF